MILQVTVSNDVACMHAKEMHRLRLKPVYGPGLATNSKRAAHSFFTEASLSRNAWGGEFGEIVGDEDGIGRSGTS